MRNLLRTAAVIGAAVFMAVTAVGSASADTIKLEKAVPLYDSPTVKGATLKPVAQGALNIPTITWGPDTLAVYADQQGLFKAEGLNVQLFHEDDFAKQVRGVLDGKTPFLRGTFGMVTSSLETFKQAGIELVPLDQISWSHGGDRLVVRDGIKTVCDLKGKTIGLQLYGPHMDFLSAVLGTCNLKPSDVKVEWFKELSVPSYDTKGQIVDARTALQNDPHLDAVFVISPDADVLTSNGAATGGTGSEGSVKGAKVLFTSASLSTVIEDGWWVRKDWFDTHQADAQKFVHAIFVANEQFAALRANKASNKAKYDGVISAASKLFEDSNDDVEGMLGDAEFVGFQGNVAFFTGTGTDRNINVIKGEVQQGLISLGLMGGTVPVTNPNFDYTKMTASLTNVNVAAIPAPRFDAAKVQAKVEQQIASEPQTWDEDGTLYVFEIYFKPNQSTFAVADYEDAFKKIRDLSQKWGGAIVTVEGHNAPDLLNKAKASGNQQLVDLQTQAAKNLSLTRAKAVRQAYIDYVKSTGLQVDDSQLIAVGMGATHPKFQVPATKEEWAANMRVVFRLKNVETEMDSFQAPGK